MGRAPLGAASSTEARSGLRRLGAEDRLPEARRPAGDQPIGEPARKARRHHYLGLGQEAVLPSYNAITLITGNPALTLLTAGTFLIRKLHISNVRDGRGATQV